MSVSNPVKPLADMFALIHRALGAIEESAEAAVLISEALASPAGAQELQNIAMTGSAELIAKQQKKNLEVVQMLKKQVCNATEAVANFNAQEA